MARLPYLDKKDLAPENRDLLERPINLNRVLVNSPDGRRVGLAMMKYIRHSSKMPPRLSEMAILQIGYLARSAYEWSHHLKIGREAGVTDGDVDGLILASEGKPAALDEQTAITLRAAREITLEGAISAETFAALQTFLDNAQVVDLVMTLAHYNGMVRLLATLQVDVEPEYLPYLARHPLPLGPAPSCRLPG